MSAAPKLSSPRNYWSSPKSKAALKLESAPAADKAKPAAQAGAEPPKPLKSTFYRQGVLVPGGVPLRPGTRSRNR